MCFARLKDLKKLCLNAKVVIGNAPKEIREI